MCFYIQQTDENQERKIATEDVVCYKVLMFQSLYGDTTCIVSPYKLSVYFEGDSDVKLVHKTSDLYTNSDDIIDKGLHSYSTKEAAMNTWMDGRLRVYEAYIPKGAKYYYNSERCELVSSELIVKNKYTII